MMLQNINIYTRGLSQKWEMGGMQRSENSCIEWSQLNTKNSKAVKLAPQSQTINCQLNHVYEIWLELGTTDVGLIDVGLICFL